MPLKQFASREEAVKFLKGKCVEIRKKIVQLTVVAGGGHIGGALSMTELLVALYHQVLNIDPKNPKMPDRDIFILSKGHGGLGLCPVLADAGFFDPILMNTFNQLDSPFGMHPDMNKIPGIEMSTGSLGHGFSVGVGAAAAMKLDKSARRVFVMIGDGECNEGTIWEAAMSAKHFKLGNLVAIVDRNRLMIDGPTEEIMSVEPFKDKWTAFGWKVVEIDGHDFNVILDTFAALPPVDSSVPTVIIANTVKGRGISFMEGEAKWHYGGLDAELQKQAVADIDAKG